MKILIPLCFLLFLTHIYDGAFSSISLTTHKNLKEGGVGGPLRKGVEKFLNFSYTIIQYIVRNICKHFFLLCNSGVCLASLHPWKGKARVSSTNTLRLLCFSF